jgi:hypothetical protein
MKKLLLLLLISSVVDAEVPSSATDNVFALAEANAFLAICYESPVYESLSNEKKQDLLELRSRLLDLVKGISNYYSDETIIADYRATTSKLSSNEELISFSKEKFQYCDDDLFFEMKSFIAEFE